MLKDEEVLKILKESEALLEGHFLLSSGLHSPKYIQCAKLLQYPDKATLVCQALAEKLKHLKIEVVIGPAMGGIIVAYEMAKSLKARAIFAEREGQKMALRRGLMIKEGEKVLLVEDVVTTGGSILEVANLVKEMKGEIVSLASLIDRQKNQELNLPLVSLLKIKAVTYDKEDCPLCKRNLPLIKPGSKDQKETRKA
ncbi:orotate phosphoribosyltransferase [bacterium]|nr:orotate phosphoribosyltransferase [bacterium]MBU1154079.1 orotate phosphoribosyltransferase [bacterium]MBU1782015.1 orotate phosphoribosyltransferase [bacterium]MBU2599071.1 orotate phosphoribosyltransferase [bacterium]